MARHAAGVVGMLRMRSAGPSRPGKFGPWADLLFFLARLASKELESTELVRVVRPYLAPLGVGA